MPICRTYRTKCSRCGWRGHVMFGDARMGPWVLPNGSYFYTERVCPSCGHQVNNPCTPEEGTPIGWDEAAALRIDPGLCNPPPAQLARERRWRIERGLWLFTTSLLLIGLAINIPTRQPPWAAIVFLAFLAVYGWVEFRRKPSFEHAAEEAENDLPQGR